MRIQGDTSTEGENLIVEKCRLLIACPSVSSQSEHNLKCGDFIGQMDMHSRLKAKEAHVEALADSLKTTPFLLSFNDIAY